MLSGQKQLMELIWPESQKLICGHKDVTGSCDIISSGSKLIAFVFPLIAFLRWFNTPQIKTRQEASKSKETYIPSIVSTIISYVTQPDGRFCHKTLLPATGSNLRFYSNTWSFWQSWAEAKSQQLTHVLPGCILTRKWLDALSHPGSLQTWSFLVVLAMNYKLMPELLSTTDCGLKHLLSFLDQHLSSLSSE